VILQITFMGERRAESRPKGGEGVSTPFTIYTLHDRRGQRCEAPRSVHLVLSDAGVTCWVKRYLISSTVAPFGGFHHGKPHRSGVTPAVAHDLKRDDDFLLFAIAPSIAWLGPHVPG
jgi:hypothetical protein